MDSIPAACNGNCGRVVHFPSRQKLFTHLREKHGVTGFQRRGRESRKTRQVTRSSLHDALGRRQPRTVSSPHRQWNRSQVMTHVTIPAHSSATGANSPEKGVTPSAIGVNWPAKAPEADAQGSSLATSATSPEQGVISPAMASSSPARGAILPAMASHSSAIGVISPAKAPPSPARAPASVNAPPLRSCLKSPVIGAISSAKAPTSLARAPISPAMAPTAAGNLPGGSNNADARKEAWAQHYDQQRQLSQSRARHHSPRSAWSAAMAPRP